MLNTVLINHWVDIKQYKFITRILYDMGKISNKSKTEKLHYKITYY